MRGLGCIVCALCVSYVAVAQLPADEYYPYAEPEERTEVLLTDSVLFYRAVQSVTDRYGALTEFNLPQVAARRRGAARYVAARLAGVELPYAAYSTLRLLGAEESREAHAATFAFPAGEPLLPYRASVGFTDRNYLVGAKVAAQTDLGRGWCGAASVEVRTGRDMHVEGVFTSAVSVGLRVNKRFDSGAELSALVVVPPSERGTRLSSSEEAFALTGDRLYNPAWGFQRGKVRNSRVRRDFVPLAVVEGRCSIAPATTFRATVSAAVGVNKYSMFNWYDARSPMPDNYRYLPSYAADRETEQAWLRGDPRYTQIDWDELIRQNRMAAGQAVYTLEDRVERSADLSSEVGFSTQIEPRLTLRYGLFARYERSRSYKQMRDLLGADRVVDLDQYLVDDDTYNNLRQNDLRHPDRVVRAGDRLGYDYALIRQQAGARLCAEYRADRLRADLRAEVGDATLFRRGYYEKELFPGAQSFGRSRKLHFTPYRFAVQVGWAFSPRRYLELSASAAAELPDVADLFYQPLYNNRSVEYPAAEREYAAAVTYRQTGSLVDLCVTAFAEASFDGALTQRYFDDLASVYCDLALSGIGRLSYGVEAAADFRLSYRWQLSVAAAAGRFYYVRDPSVTVLSDVDNTVVDQRAVSRMGGCEVGGAPQLTACVEWRYFGPKGWGARLSAGYAGRRFVEPMPLRRTDRITGQGALTEEFFDAFTRQERLDDAFTLDASAFKSFYFGRSRLTVALMLRNLLGSRNTRYSGYESLRVRRMTAGDAIYYAPHATRYTYAYPRSFYLTVGYKF